MKNTIINKTLRFVLDKDYRFRVLEKRGFMNAISDEEYIKRMYHARIGENPNLQTPESFCEKLQWLKLHDRNPKYTQLVDKFLVRDYIKETIGNDYLIPLIGVWDNPEDIDFNALPEQFVLKCTHNSGLGMCVCKDKKSLDKKRAKRMLDVGLKQQYFYFGREWPYKDVQPRIIAEQMMVDNRIPENNTNTEGLIDYKFYCFNGEAKFLYVGYANIADGKKHDLLSFYDLNWKPTPFYREDHEELPFAISKPDQFEKMIRIASTLSKGIPFVRVDLYYINSHIYFSEFTFSPGGGFAPFVPKEWNKIIGDWVNISLAWETR